MKNIFPDDDNAYPFIWFWTAVMTLICGCVILGTILYVMQHYGMISLW
jgi:hypothetical protein